MRENWIVETQGVGLKKGDELRVHGGGIRVTPISGDPQFNWSNDSITMTSNTAPVWNNGNPYTITDDGTASPCGTLTCTFGHSPRAPSWTAVEGGNGTCFGHSGSGGGGPRNER
jgi:hypothetical protein